MIRPQVPGDDDAVRRVVADAFAQCDNGEAELINRLQCASGVGDGMGLAPMAVAPARQRHGIGTTLVEAGLERLAAGGWPFVVVLGHPRFYPRFGFVPAARYAVSHGFAGIPNDVFLIKLLDKTAEVAGGTAIYSPEFGRQCGAQRTGSVQEIHKVCTKAGPDESPQYE